MADVPHEVLSEHFQNKLKGRRLVSAVFLTFKFDPGFFEQEVLPVIVDVPLSHVKAMRLVQLEDALRGLPGEISVYYDANGLVVGDTGSAHLDIRRIPVRHKTGIFHPKNVFLLVEDAEPDEDGNRVRSLLVASMSANLTRSGWWENIECCHVEEIEEGSRTRLKDDIKWFLASIKRSTPANTDHSALQDILDFLGGLEQGRQKSAGGQVHTHFYAGREPLPDFIDELAGAVVRGAYLEVLSPYFDDRAECGPLKELIDRFKPREVQVLLPRRVTGEAAVRRELYESVAAMPAVAWSRLADKKFLRLGTAEDAGERFVHAKVYRFFTQNPKREITFVGSANLTTAAHARGGNVETGFLVDVVPDRRPGFWTVPVGQKPADFAHQTEDDGIAASGGTRLNLRYHWDRAEAQAFWNATADSPQLRVTAREIEVGVLGNLPPGQWIKLPAEIAGRIAEMLGETSLFKVLDEAPEPGLLLVQEEGMSHKPSLLLRLSAADILRYWSLLTPQQRAAFIEAHGPEISVHEQGSDLVTRFRATKDDDTIFGRFAGIFHGFGCLERTIFESLEHDRDREATYRLFGRKYDSLGNLLNRIQSERDKSDPVDRYVVVLCARQLCRQVAQKYPDYWKQNADDVADLDKRIEEAGTVREEMIAERGADFADFLAWFDPWFLRRAERVEVSDN